MKNGCLLLICVADKFDGSYGKESFSFILLYTVEIKLALRHWQWFYGVS